MESKVVHYRLLPILAIIFSGCAAPQNAGPYPHGFIAFGRMHYWNPKVASVLFGKPIHDPLAEGFVIVTWDGEIIVSNPLMDKTPFLKP